MFVTFEGIEGSGKTTQIQRLARALEADGHTVIVTREPGATPIGEHIRELLLTEKSAGATPLTELLLFEADRAEHVDTVVRPALDAGKIVLSDRFFDASTAYQGAVKGVDAEQVDALNRLATKGLVPDLTILLDLSPEDTQRRLEGRSILRQVLDRFDAEKLPFHEAIRDAYLEIAEREPKRFRVVAANRSIEAIHKEVVSLVKEAL